jgi:hypothetical protein
LTHVHAQQVAERLEIRGNRHDRAHVQVAVAPTVEPLADAGRERVIDGGMTQRALDADGSQLPIRTEDTGHADDGVQLQQRDGRGRIVEIDLTGLDLRGQGGRNRLRIDFQAQ